MPLHLIGEDFLLSLVAVLEKLLHHVIPKNIRHQLQAVRLDFPENLLLLVTVGSLEFLLDET